MWALWHFHTQQNTQLTDWNSSKTLQHQQTQKPREKWWENPQMKATSSIRNTHSPTETGKRNQEWMPLRSVWSLPSSLQWWLGCEWESFLTWRHTTTVRNTDTVQIHVWKAWGVNFTCCFFLHHTSHVYDLKHCVVLSWICELRMCKFIQIYMNIPMVL